MNKIRRRIQWCTSAAMVAMCLGCRRAEPVSPPPAPPPSAAAAKTQPWFERIPESSGFDFVHRSGHREKFLFPEIETGGVGLIDYDQDGLLDILCIDGGSVDPSHPASPRHRLYHNLGNWKFVDVTTSAGLVCSKGYGMGCAVGDFDGDGWPDIYITQLGSNRLFHNNRNGTFTDVTEPAAVAFRSWSTSAAFLDYDGDGKMDLAVVNYVRWSPERETECFSAGGRRDYCSPLNYHAPAPMVLFHNRGNGTFEDATEKAGLLTAYGNGFGIAVGDFDHDGRLDMYIANDATPNQLWLNRGDGTFLDDAMLRGCALNSMGVPRAGMGVVAIDLLQTGWLDLYVTHLVGEANGLFRNQSGSFLDAVMPKGPMAGSTAYTGFGVGFGDFDNDGQADLYVANGRVRLGGRIWSPEDPYAEPNTLRRGLGQGQFEEVLPIGGTDPVLLKTSRGLAIGDLDNDGLLDLVIVNRDGPADLLRNRVPKSNHWLGLRVMDHQQCVAVHAVVLIESGRKRQWAQCQPNQGYCSSQDPRVHFGLGQETRVDHVWVRWPNGQSEEFGPTVANAYITVQQGAGHPAPGIFSW